MKKRDMPQPAAHAPKPIGGYRQLSTIQVCAIWSAYRLKTLTKFAAVRVYLALLEVDERRRAELRKRAKRGEQGGSFDLDRQKLIAEVVALSTRQALSWCERPLDRLSARD
jgi:hypothetical protein